MKKLVSSGQNQDSEKLLESLEVILRQLLQSNAQQERLPLLIDDLTRELREGGMDVPPLTRTPYLNTIEPDEQPEYPGDIQLENRIKSYIRWNAMAMVVAANRKHDGLGGHISTFASSATLYEVAFNHIYRGAKDDFPGDIVYFQGHASPGPYARAYIEGRLSDKQLGNFRQELAEGGGLSSYPHPYLMPDFWQFPTVSMGLGPIMSIYQARFNRYLEARGIIKPENQPHVYCYVGDGESDEPETQGALTMAGRERLDNLTWVVNCNLQRLDGPVRGNAKIIQELEGLFRGAGWNVIKVIWGSDWDELLARDTKGLLLKRMEETVDGEYQKYSVESGSFIRKNFFGKYPELHRMVDHLTDDKLTRMLRGGHDPSKVFAAYKAALNHKGQPTVILAKTIKGYGLGEAGEGRNITHQQKKLNEKELRVFRDRFKVPISDDEIADSPFYRPAEDSEEMKYLHARRADLGGYLPQRHVKAENLEIPPLEDFKQFLKGSGGKATSSTQAFVRFLAPILRNKKIGRNVVPIIPDEARTFGMDGLFREVGIYSSKGQLYEPVDSKELAYYREEKDGQILEEGITEAGSMSSFIAAGTAYATHGVNMIPFYIYYSMFGFQRVGDQMWLCGDIKAKGFLLGATAGRTTLNGEGLQHQDAHSLLFASTIPTLYAYDPAFAYELAVIIQDGMRRMYQEGEEIFYYIQLYNENMPMPAMPDGAEEGILKGIYKFLDGPEGDGKMVKAQIFGSGPIINHALEAQQILAEKYNVSADVWSVTNYKQLRSEALRCRRHNMLHPEDEPQKSYLEKSLDGVEGPFIAVSDALKLVADQIREWVPGYYLTLGTDGFGLSDTRKALRRFFEIDTETTVIATLYSLSQDGKIPASTVTQAIQDLGVDPEKSFGYCE